MTVAIGCTGGKHRSVAMTEEIARRLSAAGLRGPRRPTATWAGSDRPMMARSDRAQSVVAFGGGHGLSASLQALRLLVDDLVVDDLTAVVTVADNGGSSGRLRGEFGVLPPGDLRMALAALCGDDEWGDTWARVLQHRFAGRRRDARPRDRQPADRRAVGAARRPGRRPRLGRPAARHHRPGAADGADARSTSPPRCAASTRPTRDALTTVRGQVEVATTDGEIVSIALDPPDPPPCPEALAAVEAADWVVLGPGLVVHLGDPAPDGARSCATRWCSTDARVVVVLNLVDEAGETAGFGPADHLAVLVEHAPDLRIHTVLADADSVGDGARRPARPRSRRTAPCWSSPTSPRHDGSPRHDPARAGRGVRPDHDRRPDAQGRDEGR